MTKTTPRTIDRRGWSATQALCRSARPVLGEDVVAFLHDRMARVAALGIVPLRRRVTQCARGERVGGRVIFERAVSPSAAVCEPLAVLHHEVGVVLGAWHRRLTGVRFFFRRGPMDLRHLGAVREWLAVAGNASLVGIDHHGVPENRRELVAVMADGDHLRAFVSLELGECEPAWHFDGVLVRAGGNRSPGSEDGERYRNTRTDQHVL